MSLSLTTARPSPAPLQLPDSEFSWRIERLVAAMAENQFDELVLYGWPWRPDNVRYATGAATTGGATLVRITGDGAVSALVFSRDDWAAIARVGWVDDVTLAPRLDPAVFRAFLDGIPARARVGVSHLELMPAGVTGMLTASAPGVVWETATRCLDLVRLVKSGWEQERMVVGADVAARGWQAMLGVLEPGVCEYEVVAAVEREIKSDGAEDNFMLIAFGGVEVRAMHAPEDRRLGVTDMVRTELTPQVDGYYAQVCRTGVPVRPTADQQRIYDVFYAAMEAGIATVRAGVTAHEVAKAQNDILRRHGFGEYCTPQHTRVRGHALGLHPDETPGLMEGDHTVIPEGATIVVHPNTYNPVVGYMVVGDPVIVTATGSRRLVVADPSMPCGLGLAS